MALKIFNAEEMTGLADQTQCTASNSSWDNGGPFTYFRNAGGYSGPGLYESYPSVASGDAYQSTKACGFATNGYYRFRMFFQFSVLPVSPNPGRIFKTARWQSPYNAVTIDLDSAGHLKVYTSASATDYTSTLIWTSTIALPINTWIRLDVVIYTGTTTANSIVGVAGVVAPNANRRYTTNGANTTTEFYFYKTNANLGVSQGISMTNVGKAQDNVLYPWQPGIFFDDVQIDNQSFTADPNTWIANMYSTFTDVWTVRATPALVIPTTTQVNIKSGAWAARATPTLDIAGLGQGQRALSLAAASQLSVAGAASRSQGLVPIDALARLTLGQSVTHLGPTVAAGALSSLAVVPGATQAIAMSVLARAIVGGNRLPTAVLSARATAAMNLLAAIVFANYSDDEVIARILSQSADARLLAGMVGASLLGSAASAHLFDEAATGMVLPAGSMALIQD